jgi:hypothetical protein
VNEQRQCVKTDYFHLNDIYICFENPRSGPEGARKCNRLIRDNEGLLAERVHSLVLIYVV